MSLINEHLRHPHKNKYIVVIVPWIYRCDQKWHGTPHALRTNVICPGLNIDYTSVRGSHRGTLG